MKILNERGEEIFFSDRWQLNEMFRMSGCYQRNHCYGSIAPNNANGTFFVFVLVTVFSIVCMLVDIAK